MSLQTSQPNNSLSFWNEHSYDQLRRRAIGLLRTTDPGEFLQPEDLIHDAYLSLSRCSIDITDPDHYLALATRVMKHALLDRLRASRSVKRFGRLQRIALTPEVPLAAADNDNSFWMRDLLDKSTSQGSRQSEAARLHFLEQESLSAIAQRLRVSTRTIKRDIREVTLCLRKHRKTPAVC